MRGLVVRRVYEALLPVLAPRPVRVPREVAWRAYAFSSQRDLPEQVASLRSFLRHVGRPAAFTVVSDGSHSAAARALLRRVDRCVEVTDWDAVVRPDLPEALAAFAATSAMGKKLAVELSLPVERPTLYLDADVLFFAGARDLAALARDGAPAGRYLPDHEPYLDDGLLDGPHERRDPLNAGFFALYRPLDWTVALERLARLPRTPTFHGEQTLLHLALHRSGGVPLDPARYVLSVEDLHAYRDRYAGPAIALRHYTTPVRHKLWGSLWHSVRTSR